MWYLGEGMFGPLLAVFTEQIGGDILNITAAWATYLIVTGFLTIIIGGLLVNSYSFTTLFIIMGSIQVLATLYQSQILFKK